MCKKYFDHYTHTQGITGCDGNLFLSQILFTKTSDTTEYMYTYIYMDNL